MGEDAPLTPQFDATPLDMTSRHKSGQWELVALLLEEETKPLHQLPPAARARRKLRAVVNAPPTRVDQSPPPQPTGALIVFRIVSTHAHALS